MGTHQRRLLLSIHDVGPMTLDATERWRARLARHVAPSRIALLVVPDHWGRAAIADDPGFARRLRGWADEGAEIFVHGWLHRDDSAHESARARFKARRMTAGEGEFLGLDGAESLRRMRAGKALIEDITGRPAAGFIAPAWLYGPPALEALAQAGFARAEDHWRVWNPLTRTTLCRGPVITWASRSRARIAASLAAARVLRAALARQSVVRIAVHPGDLAVPAIVDSVGRTLAQLSVTHRAAAYAELG
jgi:hypothetical protein